MKEEMKMSHSTIKTFERMTCPQCNSDGILKYSKLHDRLFCAPGNWDLKKCLNSECGILWLSTLPISEELHKVYENYYTHAPHEEKNISRLKVLYQRACKAYFFKYFGYPHHVTPLESFLATILRLIPRRAAHLNFVAFHLPYKCGGSLLEVGCGGGEHLNSMAELGWVVKGIDVDPKSVEKCKELGLPVELKEIDELDPEKEKYDAIVMSHVIEHVMDPNSVIEKCYELLQPDGTLVLVTPNIDSLGHRLFKKSWLPLDPPRHLTLFNVRTLEFVCKNAGFLVKSDTSIRFSEGSFCASYDIVRKGSAVMNSSSRLLRSIAKIYQFIHFIICKISKNKGEEIVLLGKKAK